MTFRLTVQANNAMDLAQEEAHRSRYDHMGTEHQLAGLLKEGTSGAYILLSEQDIDLPNVRHQTEILYGIGASSIDKSTNLPFSPNAERTFEHAGEFLRKFDQNLIHTTHLLYGLTQNRENSACQVLLDLGIRLDFLEDRIISYIQDRQKQVA